MCNAKKGNHLNTPTSTLVDTRNTIFAVTSEVWVKGKTLIENRKSEGGEGGVTDALLRQHFDVM